MRMISLSYCAIFLLLSASVGFSGTIPKATTRPVATQPSVSERIVAGVAECEVLIEQNDAEDSAAITTAIGAIYQMKPKAGVDIFKEINAKEWAAGHSLPTTRNAQEIYATLDTLEEATNRFIAYVQDLRAATETPESAMEHPAKCLELISKAKQQLEVCRKIRAKVYVLSGVKQK